MSMMPSGGHPAEVFRDYAPGPHSGVDPDSENRVAPGSIDSRARNALVLGVLSLFLGVLSGIPAIVVGRHALGHLSAAEGDRKSEWTAWAGIVLGCLSIPATIGLWLYLHTH